jgi:uncharacterized protein (TIGR03118 family)
LNARSDKNWKVEETMKRQITSKLFFLILSGWLLAAGNATAQSLAFRQNNLASDVAGLAGQTDPFLRAPWGIAPAPGSTFLIANAIQARVITLDANGARAGISGFSVANPAGTAPAVPTGIVEDPNSFFRDGVAVPPFSTSTITATADGGLYFWAINADASSLPQAHLVVNHSQAGAVYTALAILTPDCCAEFVAAANFHSGNIEAYSRTFDPLAPAGSFTDPALPAGYAPYGMQVIGRQVFISYALQDAEKQKPVLGAGNGVVSVFDLAGDFIRRFATGGPLNAPWGIAQASANFGPFSNDILIGNVGDGTISAFDPATGNFVGQIKDGDGNPLVVNGLHGLAFSSSGVGGSPVLFFTAEFGNGQDGLFADVTAGLVSTTRVNVPAVSTNAPATITVTVSAGPGNTGDPKGMVTLVDNGAVIVDAPINNGSLQFTTVFRGVGAHHIEARYHGDEVFVPSSASTDIQIAGPSTNVILSVPANAAPGAQVTLTATVSAEQGSPTGQVEFHDGSVKIGASSINVAGVATLTTNALAAGNHVFSASYDGDGSFGASDSTPVNTMVAARDFSLAATPPVASVMPGQSISFNLTVTPAGGFADPVTFSCPTLASITCTFAPPSVTPNGAAAGTVLTVTRSANALGAAGKFDTRLWLLAAIVGVFAILLRSKRKTARPYRVILEFATSTMAVLILALTLISCGGYAAGSQSYRGTATIPVTAQSGAISHTTTLTVTLQ